MSTKRMGLKSHKSPTPDQTQANDPAAKDLEFQRHLTMLNERKDSSATLLERSQRSLDYLRTELELTELSLSRLKTLIFEVEFWSSAVDEWQARIAELGADNVK